MYKKAEASFWIAKEVNLSKDLHHWDQTLKSSKRHFVTHILAFFTVVDRITIENLADDARSGEEDGFLGGKAVHCYSLVRAYEFVSTQMVKYATSLSRKSIIDIEGEATKRFEAVYPTLKKMALAGSPGFNHRPSLLEF
ncbi:hypothetical protein M5K25_013706 [Dendrobium thyrsiflorum]|uniref:Uncharacterized protein n=1 Tax=Dendrobium thyrsiflorum TaxID=117978 RepID=A0ABD0UU32_DENTH